jgi:hypothetical protein
MKPTRPFAPPHLVTDEQGKMSAARVGLWITVAESLIVVAIDVHLAIANASARVPNTVYALLGTQFTIFAMWAAGPRIAEYIGPQLGKVVSALATARTDPREPNARTDDERGAFLESEAV